MAGDAAEQGASLGGAPGARQQGGRCRGREAEADQAQGVAREVQHRAVDVLAEGVEAGGRAPEDATPCGAVLSEPGGGLLDRVQHHAGAAVVEGVGEVHLGPAPLEAVAVEAEGVEEGRAGRHRVHRRADVVDRSGNGQLGAAGAAADRRPRPRAR